MSIAGKNTIHFTKKDLQDQKVPSVAFKNIKFAHEATLGQTVIDVLSLTTPSTGMPASFVQPNAGDLAALRLQTNKNNFTLVSSLNGFLEFDSYEITGQSQITLGYPAAAGEVFVGTLDNQAKTGLQVVDNDPIVLTTTLAAGASEIIVGKPFDLNKYPSQQQGSILVYEEGQLLRRNTSNTQSTAGDGDYYEVDTAGPTGNSIIINNTSGVARSFTIISNGLAAAAPSESLLTQLQVLAGQLDAVIPTVAALAGVPTTDFQAAPNDVDQAAFGNRLLAAEAEIVTINEHLQYGTFTMSNILGANIQTESFVYADFTRIGNLVKVVSRWNVDPLSTGSTSLQVAVSDLPFPPVVNSIIGTVYRIGNPADQGTVSQNSAQTTEFNIQATLTASGASSWAIEFSYKIS